MNKKILVIPALLLTFAFLSLPVMAKPATKIEGVTLTAENVQTEVSIRYVSHGKIYHRRGTSAGSCILTVPNLYPAGLEGTWNGESLVTCKFSQDPEPEAKLLIMGKVVLTFEGMGTFEGVSQRLIIGPLPPSVDSYYEDKIVFRGTGDFQGWTLKLSFEGPGPLIDEGYLIIPK